MITVNTVASPLDGFENGLCRISNAVILRADLQKAKVNVTFLYSKGKR
jgi:hypothetical protein